jgi:hypothetical protein
VTGAVWLLTGAQASGKSTTAELLAARFERGVHVRGGQLYRWVVRGWVHHDDADRAAARRDLDLRYRLSARIADEYATEGFTVVVNENIYGDDIERWFDALRTRPAHLVVLRPSVDAIAAREAARHAATGKTAYRGGYTPADNDADVARTPRHLGLWVDNTALTAEETVDHVLARADEAGIA